MSKKAVKAEPTVRVLKNGTCPNLSGKSTLSYRIGCTESGEIMLRLVGNSNPGYFNAEWVPYAEVQELLAKQDQGKAITSYVLTPLFRGKSTNTPSFTFAILKHEGLVKLSESKKRCYDRCSDAAFLANIKKLIDGKDVPTSSKGKAGKNNKGKVAEATLATISEAANPKPAAQEPTEKPLIVLADVPTPEVAKRGRPKKTQPVVDAEGNAANPVEGA